MAAQSQRSGSDGARGVGAGALIIGVAVIVVVLLSRPTDPGVNGAAEPSPDSSADPGPTASAPVSPTATEPSPSAEPSASATIQPTSAWQEAATFGAAGFVDRVYSVTRGADGLIAVGTHFEDIGPLVMGPAEGRVWFSSDGRSWEDITPPDTFAAAVLTRIFAAADGALIAHGYVPQESGPVSAMAWESDDGRAWSATATPFPDGSVASHLVRGAKGYLALAFPDLWLSSDGRSWEVVIEGDVTVDGIRSIGAGDDGFVALRMRGEGSASEMHAIASSDGRAWIEATVPPAGAYAVVPRGGDWVATGRFEPNACQTEPGNHRVWSSANGLEWVELGSIPLHPIPEGTDWECWRVDVTLHAAGSWLLATASAGPACCDNPPSQGTRHISRDGGSWESLSLPGVEDGSPAAGITGAIVEGDMLILVGHANNRAAFWFNEAP